MQDVISSPISTTQQAAPRELFDLPTGETYVNCAYFGPILHKVRSAGHEAMDKFRQPWRIKPHHFFKESDQLRSTFARMVGASSSEIALIPSVSYGIGVASKNLPLSRGEEILVLADQFPSNYYPWQAAAGEHGADLRIIPRPADGNWTKSILEFLDDWPKIKVAALPHVHWTDGSRIDLVAVGAACRERNIALVVDGTQSVGALPFDVREIKPDFLIVTGYKWLLGPYSLAYMYVAPHYHDGLPLEYNWVTRRGSENFARLVDYTDELPDDARRFDMGERSNFILVPMGMAALSQLLEWGVAEIQATLGRWNDTMADLAEPLGFETYPKVFRSGHMLGLRYPKGLPATIGERLADAKVHVSVRGDAIRVAPHLYNDEEDQERLRDALAGALRG